MSKPDGISISSELMSAMSALNMEPQDGVYEKMGYLSVVEYWAEHSYEHLNAMYPLLREVRQELWEIRRVTMKDMPYSADWEKLHGMFRKIEEKL